MAQNNYELASTTQTKVNTIDEAEKQQFANELGVDVSNVPDSLLPTIREHLGLDQAPDPDLIVDHVDLVNHHENDKHETHRAAQIAKHVLSKYYCDSDLVAS